MQKKNWYSWQWSARARVLNRAWSSKSELGKIGELRKQNGLLIYLFHPILMEVALHVRFVSSKSDEKQKQKYLWIAHFLFSQISYLLIY